MEGDAAKDETKSEDADVADPYTAYRTKGNTWTLKSWKKVAGADDSIAYTKYEVLEVTADKATVKMSSWFNDPKDAFAQNDEVLFEKKPAKPVSGAPAPAAPKVVVETIKVEAGEFECTKSEDKNSKMKTTTWVHRKFPAILVKLASKSKDYEGGMELVKIDVR